MASLSQPFQAGRQQKERKGTRQPEQCLADNDSQRSRALSVTRSIHSGLQEDFQRAGVDQEQDQHDQEFVKNRVKTLTQKMAKHRI